ncbi:beta-aspartyl-peptidase (threonine type) [Amycolatopsis arida]|uniref:Beta-aspartyl-peptidase (Threonine type) n=1 Tax=Amycolatopsis arida TaxID=587909 RepID=A0A1I6AR93_9PSEU|nr:isoaspartyl peptidase/L-asparaginase [Amycolatopsis arida]TDX97596.1 beta-aspartyl-peptidase (threonine type) [Amycolatopsis arida]SFQ71166.1 beta-aspartyl-peptidase (threonine type) [Amycolatopsis arida]
MLSRPRRGILVPLSALAIAMAGALSGSAAGATAPAPTTTTLNVTAPSSAASGAAVPADGTAPEAAGGASVVRDVVLAVHGGAGSLPRGSLTPERERAYRAGLEEALRAGLALINEGRSSLDAVEAAVRVLEDDPTFNAGKGAVFNTDAEHELDASIMNGRDQRSGAVAGVHNTRNPISLARMVMERSRHVLMAGEGADAFALQHGVPYTTQDYFFTQRRWDALMAAKNPATDARPRAAETIGETVGAVAVDRHRDVAAATSTGGLTNKLVGRVGDSPIIGAGTYANNRTVAISCTGTGEVFIRGVAAHDISALMEYAGKPVQRAAATVITEKIPALGATGGAIALDPRGRLATPHSTAGLINGYVTRDGTVVTRIYDDETPSR